MHWLQGFAQNLSWLPAGLWEKIWKRFVAEGNTYHIVPTSHLNIYVNHHIIFVKSECCNIKHSKAWILHTGILLHAWVIRFMSGNSSQKAEIKDFIKHQKHQKKSNQKIKKRRTKLKTQKKIKINNNNNKSKIIKQESNPGFGWFPPGCSAGSVSGSCLGRSSKSKKRKKLETPRNRPSGTPRGNQPNPGFDSFLIIFLIIFWFFKLFFDFFFEFSIWFVFWFVGLIFLFFLIFIFSS